MALWCGVVCSCVQAFVALKRGENQETWTDKCEGLTIFRTLLMHHRPVLDESLGVVVDAINAEVLNLRSQVAHVAMLALADFFTFVLWCCVFACAVLVAAAPEHPLHRPSTAQLSSRRVLGKGMDMLLSKCVACLLKKAGAEAR